MIGGIPSHGWTAAGRSGSITVPATRKYGDSDRDRKAEKICPKISSKLALKFVNAFMLVPVLVPLWTHTVYEPLQ